MPMTRVEYTFQQTDDLFDWLGQVYGSGRLGPDRTYVTVLRNQVINGEWPDPPEGVTLPMTTVTAFRLFLADHDPQAIPGIGAIGAKLILQAMIAYDLQCAPQAPAPVMSPPDGDAVSRALTTTLLLLESMSGRMGRMQTEIVDAAALYRSILGYPQENGADESMDQAPAETDGAHE